MSARSKTSDKSLLICAVDGSSSTGVVRLAGVYRTGSAGGSTAGAAGGATTGIAGGCMTGAGCTGARGGGMTGEASRCVGVQGRLLGHEITDGVSGPSGCRSGRLWGRSAGCVSPRVSGSWVGLGGSSTCSSCGSWVGLGGSSPCSCCGS